MSGRLGMTGSGVARGDAEIAKSFIPGHGYRRAVDLPKAVLGELAGGGRKKMASYERGKEAAHSADVKSKYAALHRFQGQYPTYHSTKGVPRPRILDNAVMDQAHGPGTGAFAFKTGGRRSPGKIYARPHADPGTIAHEHAHITPKRSGYRMYQINQSPRLTMREEARADYMAGSHYKNSTQNPASDYQAAAMKEKWRNLLVAHHSAAGDTRQAKQYNRPTVSAYRNVQDRMSYAGTKRSKYAKSYMPKFSPNVPHGWVRPLDMHKGAYRGMVRGKAREVIGEQNQQTAHETQGFKDLISRRHQQLAGVGSPAPGGVHELEHSTMDRAQGPVTQGFHMKTGGPQAKSHMFVRPDANPTVVAHEMAHGAPKRSAYRLHQISQDPHKVMREEARADFTSGQRLSRPNPAGMQESNYMRAARNEQARGTVHAEFTAKAPGKARMFEAGPVGAYRDVMSRMEAGAARRRPVSKVETTMSDVAAHKIAARYDTRGPLPKGLSREAKMKAYEGRYIASGGRKAEKWQRRATGAEALRNVGLAGVTAGSAGFLAVKGKRTGAKLRSIPKLGRHLTQHKMEMGAAGAAVLGGSSELYGEHARALRASYNNSPAGVAGSALSRMRAYTPEKKP